MKRRLIHHPYSVNEELAGIQSNCEYISFIQYSPNMLTNDNEYRLEAMQIMHNVIGLNDIS